MVQHTRSCETALLNCGFVEVLVEVPLHLIFGNRSLCNPVSVQNTLKHSNTLVRQKSNVLPNIFRGGNSHGPPITQQHRTQLDLHNSLDVLDG